MGVCGCGKSTIASAFAAATGGEFLDGDDFHPPANIEKMRHAIPLDDADRVGWLESLRDAIGASHAPIVCVACSALKRKYRDILRQAGGDIEFVLLHGSRELLAARMAARTSHFMRPELLDSQLADLEPPARGTEIDTDAPPEEIVTRLREKFGL
jgi:gluconokinase